MKKIKGLLVAFVALFAFTLAMVTANAATEEIVTKVTIDSDSVTKDGITFTSSGMKSTEGWSITGTSIIDGTTKTYETGTKLNSGATLKFTAQYEWSALLLIASGTADQTLSSTSGTPVVVNPNTANGCGTVQINGGQPGEVTITRGGSKEMWVFEIVLTQTKNLDAEYVNVYFHDVNGDAGAAVPVEKGSKATAAAATPILGKKFVNWTLQDGTAFDFNTAINEETHLYPVYSDLSLTVTDKNVLSRDYLKSLLSVWSTMPTITERTEFKGTNFALAAGAGLLNNDTKKFEGEDEQAVYAINTNGRLGCSDGNWNNAVEFNAPSAGVLKIYGRSGNANPRALSLTTDNETFVSSEAVGQDNITLLTLNVAASGTYYLGCQDGGFKIYSIEFEASKVASVNLLQERVAVDEVEHIRLVAVVENVKDLSDLSLVLKSDALDADVNLTEDAKVAKRITDHAETYTLGGVTFEAKDGVVYVKCVVEVAAKYADASFTAELTVGGITKTVTVNVLA